MIVPELTLTKQVCLNITASNKFSNQTLTIAVKSNDINSDISQGYVLLIFLLIIMTTLILFTFMFNKILNAKLKSESKSKDTDLRHSKGILFGSRRSEEVKIDRLTYEQMKKFETTLETLHENFEQEEQDDKIESNIRNSMNYKIQDNTDSYKTEMFTNRASRISNAFRNSYNRSSTKSYYESLNKKKKEGFKGNTLNAVNYLEKQELVENSKFKDKEQEEFVISNMEREIFENIPRTKHTSIITNEYKIEHSSDRLKTKATM